VCHSFANLHSGITSFLEDSVVDTGLCLVLLSLSICAISELLVVLSLLNCEWSTSNACNMRIEHAPTGRDVFNVYCVM